MSEYNIQMNKYNALNAGYDQLYPATKIANVDGLDTALQNKAPAWLVSKSHTALSSLDGVMSAIEDDLNIMSNRTATYIGLHFSADVQPFGTMNTIVELYKSSNGYAIAIAYHPLHGIIINRIYGGTWTGWEYLNPPMALGVEYRTTERHMGKPVYKQLFALGKLSSTAGKAEYYPFGEDEIAGTHNAFSADFYALNSADGYSGWMITLPAYNISGRLDMAAKFSGPRIEWYTGGDWSSYYGYAILKYTKPYED